MKVLRLASQNMRDNIGDYVDPSNYVGHTPAARSQAG